MPLVFFLLILPNCVFFSEFVSFLYTHHSSLPIITVLVHLDAPALFAVPNICEYTEVTAQRSLLCVVKAFILSSICASIHRIIQVFSRYFKKLKMEAPRLPSMVTWWSLHKIKKIYDVGKAVLKHTTSSRKRETTSQRMRRHLQATAQQALQREGSTSPGTGSLPTMFVGFAGGLTHNDGENLVCGSPSSPGILSMFVLCVTCVAITKYQY